jgi:hypothetical protein
MPLLRQLLLPRVRFNIRGSGDLRGMPQSGLWAEAQWAERRFRRFGIGIGARRTAVGVVRILRGGVDDFAV